MYGDGKERDGDSAPTSKVKSELPALEIFRGERKAWVDIESDLYGQEEKLTKSIEIFTECGTDGWVEKYEKELAALS